MTVSNPKISVILPTYNGERWLRESIQSVLDQTETNWELIIVNDCSTDDTLQIAEDFAAHDKRIRIISNETNKKLPMSLNIGFREATGKYLTWTSDDNIYMPNALATMSEHLEENPVSVGATFSQLIVDEDKNVLATLADNCTRGIKSLILSSNWGGAFMYRKSVADKIGEYDADLFCAEDYDYFLRLALFGRVDYVDGDAIYLYREHGQSLSSTKVKLKNDGVRRVQHKYADEFFDKYEFTHYDRALACMSIKKKAPIKYRPLMALLRIYKYLVKIAVLPLFWNTLLRRRLRNALLPKISPEKKD